MPASKPPLLEAAIELAWSHWSALGVRGVAHPPGSAVDPEALLYFTACIAEHEPRLQAEVADWWNQYQHHLSRSRMTALARRYSDGVVAKLVSLEHAFATTPRTGKARLDHLATPARSMLRLRCAFGASARAEVLLELLTRARTDEGLTVLALSEVGYSKRNVANVLDDLVMAGILLAAREGNRVRYRVARPEVMTDALGPLPSAPGRWHLRLPIVAAFVELAVRLRGRDATVQGVEARKELRARAASLAAAGITAPGPSVMVETYWPALQAWLIENVLFDAADTAKRVPRMIEGVWLRGSRASERAASASSAVLPRSSASTHDDTELLCLDLVQVPTVEPHGDWAWAVLSTAATSVYAHASGLERDPAGWRFVTSQFGEPRTYQVAYADPLPHAQIEGLYGAHAAARARADRPAVQLRLARVTP